MITFHCPSCGMKLQVPEEMAGVTGPCPQCSATIIAPQPKPPMAAAPIPSSQPAPAPAPTHQPQQAQVPTQPQVQTQPLAQTQPQAQPQGVSALSSSQVSRPVSQSAPVPVRRESPAVTGAPMVEKVRRQSGGPPRRSRWMRVVFPLAFLLLAAILVLVVLNAAGFLNLWNLDRLKAKIMGQEDVDKKPTVTAPAAAPASATVPLTKIEPATKIPAAEPKEIAKPPTAPTPAATPDVAPSSEPADSTMPPADGEFPDLTPPTPAELKSPPETGPMVKAGSDQTTSSDSLSPPKAGSLLKDQRFLANEILEKFLNAESLDERLALMAKSKYSPEELGQSCLVGKLKPVKSNYFAEMVPRLEDDMRQYRYYVAFEDKKEERDRMLMVLQLVERPGIHPPRVNGDAFIEHYEKKLDYYGLNPTKKATTFHCIAEARTADLAKSLPDDLKRSMIRMVVKTHPRGKPAFDAYLSKNSPLMERIGPRGDFPYVESRFCILTFRWNTTRPKQPFIELIDIVTMGWER